MYEAFFELEEAPFSLSPDPRYLWLSETHQEALNALYYGITSRAGFMLLTGEVGAGKTTVLRACLDHLPQDTLTAMVFNTSEIAPRDLLSLLLAELGIEDRGASKAHQLVSLHEYLIRQMHAENNIVLVIDEAQNLPHETLEEIRLLSNFETNTSKLLQIVLTGQPELLDKLEEPRLRQLRQRIVIDHHLDYLSADEVGSYIRHRIERAGGNVETIFEPGFEKAFYFGSKGCPRLVSLLAHKCMFSAFSKRIRPVPLSIVTEKSRGLPPVLVRENSGVVDLPVPSERRGRRD